MEKTATQGYPFKGNPTLMAEGKTLAKHYRISFNMLLTLLLESAIEEWSVPGMEAKPRPEAQEQATEEQKTLT